MNRLVKKLIGWILCAVMVVGMLPVATRGAKAADTDVGTPEGIVWNAVENRYEISSYEGLLEFARIVNGTPAQFETNSAANAILTKSFSAEESTQGNTWTPIGNSSSPYIGTFDGKGYTITGLTIESTGNDIGLFERVGKDGCVQNVNLEGGSIKGNKYVGSVVGFNEGKVSNCYYNQSTCQKSAIGSGTSGIMIGSGALEGGQASNVWFGNYEQDSTSGKDPVKWRVLSNGADGIFVLSDQNLDCKLFDNTWEGLDFVDDDCLPDEMTWSMCTLRTWLNKEFYKAVFSTREQGSILETKVITPDHSYFGTEGGDDTMDKVFLLSLDEVNSSEYGFTNQSSKVASSTDYAEAKEPKYGVCGWWLRSPGSDCTLFLYVRYDGAIETEGWFINERGIAIRPVFNINPASVVFVSAAVGGKSSGAAGAGALKEVSAYDGTDWKLTVKDDTRKVFTANLTSTRTTYSTGDTISIHYSGAMTGENEYVSAMIVDSNNIVRYYSHLVDNSASGATADGTAELTIPEDIAGNCKILVFSEQCNGDYKTDFTRNTAELDITVNATITWKNWDGTELETDVNVSGGETPSYDGETPKKKDNKEYSYPFIGWDPEVEKVTGNATYTAKFNSVKNAYTIKFVNEDGTELQSSEVEYGTTPEYSGKEPTKKATKQYSYTWTGGWDKEIVEVTGEETYTATFTATTNKYEVIFDANGHGTTPDKQTVAYGETASEPVEAEVNGFTFGGWYTTAACTDRFDFTTAITDKITLFAKWTVDSTEPEDPGKTEPEKPDKTTEGGSSGEPGKTDGTTIELYYILNEGTIQYTKGSTTGIIFTVKRAKDDLNCFKYFSNVVKIDGRKITKYTAKSGSTIVTLDPEILDGLTDGEHLVSVLFDDGSVDVKILIKTPMKATEEMPTSPQTGDSSPIALWIALMLLTGMTGVIVLCRRKSAD